MKLQSQGEGEGIVQWLYILYSPGWCPVKELSCSFYLLPLHGLWPAGIDLDVKTHTNWDIKLKVLDLIVQMLLYTQDGCFWNYCLAETRLESTSNIIDIQYAQNVLFFLSFFSSFSSFIIHIIFSHKYSLTFHLSYKIFKLTCYQ